MYKVLFQLYFTVCYRNYFSIKLLYGNRKYRDIYQCHISIHAFQNVIPRHVVKWNMSACYNASVIYTLLLLLVFYQASKLFTSHEKNSRIFVKNILLCLFIYKVHVIFFTGIKRAAVCAQNDVEIFWKKKCLCCLYYFVYFRSHSSHLFIFCQIFVYVILNCCIFQFSFLYLKLHIRTKEKNV